MNKLPTYRGYTVDVKLRQFRKVGRGHGMNIEFVDFDSERGQRLLGRIMRDVERGGYYPKEYDYNKENHKQCPVCLRDIDYHIGGFMSFHPENIWVGRDHTATEIEQAVQRKLTAYEIALFEL